MAKLASYSFILSAGHIVDSWGFLLYCTEESPLTLSFSCFFKSDLNIFLCPCRRGCDETQLNIKSVLQWTFKIGIIGKAQILWHKSSTKFRNLQEYSKKEVIFVVMFYALFCK